MWVLLVKCVGKLCVCTQREGRGNWGKLSEGRQHGQGSSGFVREAVTLSGKQ